MNNPADYHIHKIKMAHLLREAIAAVEAVKEIESSLKAKTRYERIIELLKNQLKWAEYVGD